MLMRRMTMFTVFVTVFMMMFASLASAAAPDYQKLGFPTVVAEQTIEPDQAATIAYGTVKIDVPAGTFSNPVKFQVVEGPLADFQAKAPLNETVLMDFAFRVTDAKTNELVGSFQKPVVFHYTDAKINTNSKYYDTLPDGTFVLNKVPAKIEGNTLSHPIKGAGVGWAVTSPAVPVQNATSPVTGLSLLPWITAGATIMAIGSVVIVRARRSTN